LNGERTREARDAGWTLDNSYGLFWTAKSYHGDGYTSNYFCKRQLRGRAGNMAELASRTCRK